VDASGNVFVADSQNLRIREITASGTISTVAGSGTVKGSQNQGEECGTAGCSTIPLYFGDGGSATSAGLAGPTDVAISPAVTGAPAGYVAGQLYIADQSRVRAINPGGVISTLAGSGTYNYGGDGGPATQALLSFSLTTAVDSAGNIYIPDFENNRIRKVSTSGVITTIAGNGTSSSTGDGGPAVNATVFGPSGVAVDASGDIYISEIGGQRIRKIAANGIVSTVAGNGTIGFSGDGGTATQAALSYPAYVTVDGQGNLYFVDFFNSRVRKVTSAGVISTVAGNGQSTTSGDNGPATSAGMTPFGLAVSANGTIYIADDSAGSIRKVSGGAITTLFTLPNSQPQGLALDAAGDVVVCFKGGNGGSSGIGSISPSGAASLLAGGGSRGFSGDGGPALNAQMKCQGVAVDTAGNVYVADGDNDRVRKISTVLPTVSVSTTTLTFAAVEGTIPAAQQVQVTGTAGIIVQATPSTTSGGSWLSVSPGAGSVPVTLSVTAGSQTLAPGSYQGSVVVQVGSTASTVNVQLTVTAAPPGQLTLSPSSISVQAQAGASSPGTQSITIGNTGAGTLNWTATAAAANGGAWLSVSPASGTALLLTPAVAQVSFNTSTLAAGVYTGSITVNPGALVVAVRLTVSSSAPALVLGQTGLFFNAAQGGIALASQGVDVTNPGSGTLNWTASVLSGTWLSVSPPSGSSTPQSPGGIQLSANISGLSAGVYYGLAQVAAAGAVNSPQLISVVLNVAPATVHQSPLVYPLGLILSAPAGQSNIQSVQLSTASSTAVPLSVNCEGVSGGTTWLAASASGNSVNPVNLVQVTANSQGLTPGVYQGAVSLVFGDGSPTQNVNVLFVVTPSSSGGVSNIAQRFNGAAAAGCTPQSVLMVMRQLGSGFSSPVGWPVDLEAQLADNCGNPATGATVVATFSNGDPPLALANIGNGIYSATWKPATPAATTTVTLTGLQAPLLPATITISGSSTTNPTPPPFIAAGGVVNGASFAAGADVAPGGIVSVFGSNLGPASGSQAGFPLPTNLGGITLTIGGINAPLFYSGSGQVNAQLPFEIPANSQTQVVARAISGSTESDAVPEPVTISAAHPGIFTTNGTLGAILNVSYQLVSASNPANPGDVIQIYCTGLGATNPPSITGQAAVSGVAVIEPAVTVGGLAAGLQYAGVAPGFVGLYQVNVAIPSSVTPGSAVPVVITQNGIASNTATIVVQ
jgi:uncharacterized protein (TIGR03437 family)